MNSVEIEAQGKKDVFDAVAIAALTALATALIGLGVDEIKRQIAKRNEAEKAARKT